MTGGGPKMVEKQDRETTFSPTNSSKDHWNTANSTKQLLNADRGQEAPRKTAHCLQKEVGQNIIGKKRDKRVRDGDPSWGGSRDGGEVSKHQETLSPAGLCSVLESQRATQLGGKKSPQITCLTATPSGEVAPDTCVHHQEEGAKQGGVGCIAQGKDWS